MHVDEYMWEVSKRSTPLCVFVSSACLAVCLAVCLAAMFRDMLRACVSQQWKIQFAILGGLVKKRNAHAYIHTPCFCTHTIWYLPDMENFPIHVSFDQKGPSHFRPNYLAWGYRIVIRNKKICNMFCMVNQVSLWLCASSLPRIVLSKVEMQAWTRNAKQQEKKTSLQ